MKQRARFLHADGGDNDGNHAGGQGERGVSTLERDSVKSKSPPRFSTDEEIPLSSD